MSEDIQNEQSRREKEQGNIKDAKYLNPDSGNTNIKSIEGTKE